MCINTPKPDLLLQIKSLYGGSFLVASSTGVSEARKLNPRDNSAFGARQLYFCCFAIPVTVRTIPCSCQDPFSSHRKKICTGLGCYVTESGAPMVFLLSKFDLTILWEGQGSYSLMERTLINQKCHVKSHDIKRYLC